MSGPMDGLKFLLFNFDVAFQPNSPVEMLYLYTIALD